MASAFSNRALSLNGALDLSKCSMENFLKHPQAILVRRLMSRAMSASSVMRPPKYMNWWTWWYFWPAAAISSAGRGGVGVSPVDRVVGLVEVDEPHIQRDFPLSAQFLKSQRTTNSMSMVDRAGRKPRCSSGSICCASQKSLRRLATIFSSNLPAWETREIPLKLLQSDRSDFLWSTLIVASFLWDFLSSPHADENGVEMLEDDGLAGGVVQFE